MKKVADPKFLESTVSDVARWAQKHIAPQSQTNWGDAAGKFWHNHGGKVMGGLGGVAAGALGAAAIPKKKRGNLSWLLPLLAGGAGVAGGHYFGDRGISKLAAAALKPDAPAAAATPAARTSTPLARDARPGGRMPNNANMSKVAFIAKVAFENPLGGVDWSKLWNENKGKIIGGLGGAALGGLGGAMMNGEDENGETHGVRNGVLGALAGLGLGAGGGHLYDDPAALAKLKGLVGLGGDDAAPAAPGMSTGAKVGLGAAGGAAAGGAGALALRRFRGRNPAVAAARGNRSRMANIMRALGYSMAPAAGAVGGGYAGSQF